MTSRARASSAARLLAEAGPTMSIPEYAQVMGISDDTAYALAKRGELGVRVLRFGRKLRVSTAELRRILGLRDGTP